MIADGDFADMNNATLAGGRFRRSTLVTALLASSALASIQSVPALAQTPPASSTSISIPAQPLSSALIAFSRQTRIEIFVPSSLAAGKRSAAVSDATSPEAALQRLLAGTGLAYRFTGARSVTVEARRAPGAAGAAPAGAIALDEVVVDGAGLPPPTGTIGQPPVPYAGGQVGTGTRLGFFGNRSVMTTPFNVTGYTDKLMRDQQARSLADVVQNDPSVRNDAPAFSERDSFFIRGFSVVNLDTAFDGLAYIANPRRSFVEGIERVEILKGPTALLNGGIARIGGTINLIPKRAFDEPLTRVTTTYLSDSQLWTHLDLGRRFGASKEWGVRFNGSYRQGDTALDTNDIEVGNASLGLDYRGDRFRASLDLAHSTQNVTAPTSLFNEAAPGIVIPRAPNGRKNTSSSLEYIDSRYNMIAGRMEFDLTPDTTIYAAAGASRYREDFLSSYYRINGSGGRATNSLTIMPLELQGFSGEVGLRSKFQTGFISHQFNISASQAINENYSRGFFPVALPSFPTNIYAPVHLPRGSVSTFSFPRSSQQPLFTRLNLRSIAVADTLSMAGDRIQVTLGGRYQHIDLKSYVTRPVPTQGARASNYQEGRFSPAIAALIRPTDKLSVYANYIEGLTEGPSAPARAVNANEVFAPVVNKQTEIGVKYDFGTVAMTASLFEIRQPNAFTDPATNRFSVSGLQVNRGLELTMFGEPFEGVRLLGGVTFMHAELASTAGGLLDGKTAPGIPRTAINLYGEYDLPWVKGLTATGRIIYTSSMFYDQANTQSVPDWTRFDIGLRYAFTGPAGKPVVVRAGVENVFDASYWASAARGFLAVGAPRTFVVSAQVDF
jgi:iron complex outermembrane receptor protein